MRVTLLAIGVFVWATVPAGAESPPPREVSAVMEMNGAASGADQDAQRKAIEAIASLPRPWSAWARATVEGIVLNGGNELDGAARARLAGLLWGALSEAGLRGFASKLVTEPRAAGLASLAYDFGRFLRAQPKALEGASAAWRGVSPTSCDAPGTVAASALLGGGEAATVVRERLALHLRRCHAGLHALHEAVAKLPAPVVDVVRPIFASLVDPAGERKKFVAGLGGMPTEAMARELARLRGVVAGPLSSALCGSLPPPACLRSLAPEGAVLAHAMSGIAKARAARDPRAMYDEQGSHELLYQSLDGEGKAAYDTALEHFLGKREPGATGDACVALCGIVDRALERWGKGAIPVAKEGVEATEGGAQRFAIEAQAALLVAKAAPYCPTAREALAKRVLPPARGALSLDGLIAQTAIGESGGKLVSRDTQFGRIYLRELLANLKETGKLPSPHDRYEQTLFGIELRNAVPLAFAKSLPLTDSIYGKSEGDSFFTTFLRLSSALSLDPRRVPSSVHRELDKAIAKFGIGGLPYDLTGSNPDMMPKDPRGHVTVAVLGALLKYRGAVAAGGDSTAAWKDLDSATEAFARYAPTLLLHAERDMRGAAFHMEPDGIAPYYFHPTIPYVLTALRWLESVPGISEAVRGRIAERRARLVRLLLGSLAPDQSIARAPTRTFPSSPLWMGALTGLALTGAVDGCGGAGATTGILAGPVARPLGHGHALGTRSAEPGHL